MIDSLKCPWIKGGEQPGLWKPVHKQSIAKVISSFEGVWLITCTFVVSSVIIFSSFGSNLLKGNNFDGGNNKAAASSSEGKTCFTIKMQNKNMVKTVIC